MPPTKATHRPFGEDLADDPACGKRRAPDAWRSPVAAHATARAADSRRWPTRRSGSGRRRASAARVAARDLRQDRNPHCAAGRVRTMKPGPALMTLRLLPILVSSDAACSPVAAGARRPTSDSQLDSRLPIRVSGRLRIAVNCGNCHPDIRAHAAHDALEGARRDPHDG